jgi:DNA polymerase-1
MIYNPKEVELSATIGLDLETSGLLAWQENILAIAITTDTTTYVLEPRLYSHEYLTNLFKRIRDNCFVIGHNLKFDANFIYVHYGILLRNVGDTQLASQLIDAGKSRKEVSHSLVNVIERYLGTRLIESEMKKFLQQSFVGMKPTTPLSEEQLQYAGDDTRLLIPLYNAQLKKIQELGLEKILRLENTLLPVLVKMECHGCRIDVDGWRNVIKNEWYVKRDQYEHKLDAELVRLSEEVNALRGKYTRPRRKQEFTVLSLFDAPKTVSNENEGNINYGSSDQILELFRVVGEPVPTIVDDGEVKESAGEDSLLTYLTEHPRCKLSKFIDILLKYREYEKLISTYGEEFLSKLDANNYIHTEYSQCFTATGRLSSRGPNLQNIPATDIRRLFIPDPDDVMITCDMEGAEVRIAGDFSGEKALINSVIAGEDLHSKLASKSYSIIFGKPIKISKSKEPMLIGEHSLVPQTLRDTHKSVLFAKFYKGGAKRVYEVLAEYINLFHEGDARMEISRKISSAIDRALPTLTKYLSGLIDEAQQKGYLRANQLGRLRWFDKNVYGEAANYPIQGTNADAMKIALIQLDRWFEETGYGRIVLTVHDEVVCSVKKQFKEVAAAKIHEIMYNALGYFLTVIPGGASVSIENFWKK